MSGVKKRRSSAEFQIGNKRVIKSLDGRNSKKLRNEALLNRTEAELWARDILFKTIGQREITEEHNFQFRRFDFYFQRIKVAIEIDGPYHNTDYQKEYDRKVDQYLYKKYRIKVLRVKNMDLDDLMSVIENIKSLFREKDIKVDRSFKEQSNGFKKHQSVIRKEKDVEIKSVHYNERKKKYEEILDSKPKVILRKTTKQIT